MWDAFIDKSLVVSCDLHMTLEYLSLEKGNITYDWKVEVT